MAFFFVKSDPKQFFLRMSLSLGFVLVIMQRYTLCVFLLVSSIYYLCSPFLLNFFNLVILVFTLNPCLWMLRVSNKSSHMIQNWKSRTMKLLKFSSLHHMVVGWTGQMGVVLLLMVQFPLCSLFFERKRKKKTVNCVTYGIKNMVHTVCFKCHHFVGSENFSIKDEYFTIYSKLT